MNNTHLEPRIIFRITAYMWVHPSPVSHFDVDFGLMAHCSQHLIIMPVYCLRGVLKVICSMPMPSKQKKYSRTFLNIKVPCTLYELALPQLKTQRYKIRWLHTKHGTGWPFSMYVMYMAHRNDKLRCGILVFPSSFDESIAFTKKKIPSPSSSSLSSYAGTKGRLDPSILLTES
jgi:hypothetical protein